MSILINSPIFRTFPQNFVAVPEFVVEDGMNLWLSHKGCKVKGSSSYESYPLSNTCCYYKM